MARFDCRRDFPPVSSGSVRNSRPHKRPQVHLNLFSRTAVETVKDETIEGGE